MPGEVVFRSPAERKSKTVVPLTPARLVERELAPKPTKAKGLRRDS